MKKSPFIFSAFLVAVLASCNLPNSSIQETQSPNEVFTQAAQTVAAELTRVGSLASPTSNIPTSTFTPTSTNTPIPTASNTPIPCNLATWDPATIDVTIPDNTIMAPNQLFTKTWRIRNIGTCSWNSSYLLIFDHGDGLGITTGYTQQLTTGVVNPGQWVDLSVNLKAPASNGPFTGFWRLRDPGGIIFGITPTGGTFAVKIIVVTTTSITLLPVIGESGSGRSDSVVTTAEYFIGDASTDKGLQLFISYNISGIPSNATITEVKLDMRNGNILGNPFTNLGILNLYLHDFIPLDGSDYVIGLPGGNVADWGSTTALGTVEVSPELKTALQARLGTSRIQFRFQFEQGTDSDGVIDAVQYLLSSGILNNPALLVKYTTP